MDHLRRREDDDRFDRDLDREVSENTLLESVVQTDSFLNLTKLFSDTALSTSVEWHQGVRESGSDEEFRRLPRVSLRQCWNEPQTTRTSNPGNRLEVTLHKRHLRHI